MKRTEREYNHLRKIQKRRAHIRTGTWYLGIRIMCTTVCWKESTAQHGAAPHRKARHRTAAYGDAEL